MDIFQFAIEKEQLSEDYYRRLASEAPHAGLKNIFNMLADEESKHRQAVEQMSREIPAEIAETTVLSDAKEVFLKMRESAQDFKFDVSEAQLYKKALDFERQSKKFYLQKSQEVQDPRQKEIFVRLANEEQKHYRLIENICDFVARPQWFLENAEMYRFDDYIEGGL